MREAILDRCLAISRLAQQALSAAAVSLLAGGALAAAPSTPAAGKDPGQLVYEQQHCLRCHALAGKGNRLRPLDDVGARLDAAQIRAIVTADPAAGVDFDKRALAAKKKYAKLPSADLDALVQFLLAQKKAPPTL